jgi:hypothetical protein
MIQHWYSRPTSCRLAAASAGNTCQNATDLAREAVGYSGGLGGESKLRLTSVDLLRGKRYVLQLLDQTKSGAGR